MKFAYKNWEWNDAGEIELNENVFKAPLRKDLIARVIRWQRAKARQGTHSTKTLSMVSGTTRKPWGQKETGRARQGSLRSAQFRGGGVVFGPHPRDHAHDLNKKVKKLAAVSTLSDKLKEGQFNVVENMELPFEKTSRMVEWLNERKMKSVLFVCDNLEEARLVQQVISNVPHCDILPVCGLNVYDMVRHDQIICAHSAIKSIENRYFKEAK